MRWAFVCPTTPRATPNLCSPYWIVYLELTGYVHIQIFNLVKADSPFCLGYIDLFDGPFGPGRVCIRQKQNVGIESGHCTRAPSDAPVDGRSDTDAHGNLGLWQAPRTGLPATDQRAQVSVANLAHAQTPHLR